MIVPRALTALYSVLRRQTPRGPRSAGIPLLIAALLASVLLPANSWAAETTPVPASVTDAARAVAQGARPPAGFVSTYGELVAGADSPDPVTREQVAAVRNLIEPTYRLTRVVRTGTVLLAQSFYSGPAGVIVAARTALLPSANALPTALRIVGASAASQSPDGKTLVGALADSAGNVLRESSAPSSTASASLGGCNCETAWYAVLFWTVVCVAAAAEAGPAAPGMGEFCWVAAAGMGGGAGEYCNRCSSTRHVVMQPQVAEAWQDTDHDDPHFYISYPQNWPPDLTLGFDTNASLVWRSAGTRSASYWGGDFQIIVACCDTGDSWYDTTGWVQYPAGDWGYAHGRLLVHGW